MEEDRVRNSYLNPTPQRLLHVNLTVISTLCALHAYMTLRRRKQASPQDPAQPTHLQYIGITLDKETETNLTNSFETSWPLWEDALAANSPICLRPNINSAPGAHVFLLATGIGAQSVQEREQHNNNGAC